MTGADRLDRSIPDSSGCSDGRTLESSRSALEAFIDGQSGDRTALKALWRQVFIGLALTVILAAIIVLVST